MLKYQKNLQFDILFLRKFRHNKEHLCFKLAAAFKTINLKVLKLYYKKICMRL